MIKLSADIEVGRPAPEVFDYLSNFENNPRWQRGQREARWTTDPPTRVGSTYDQVAVFMGKEIVSSFRVEAYDPGRMVEIRSTGGSFPLHIVRRVDPIDANRTRVRADIEGDPSRFFRLFRPLLRVLAQRSVTADYKRLKEVLEGR